MNANLFRASEMGIYWEKFSSIFLNYMHLLLFNFTADFPFHDIKTVLCLS